MKSIGPFVRGLLFACAFTVLPVTAGCDKKDDAKEDKADKKGDKSDKKDKEGDKSDKDKSDKSEKGDKAAKKDEKADKADKKDDKDGEKKPDGDEKKAKSGSGGEFVRASVLKHMPKDCAMGKVYLDLGLLLKNEAVQASWTALQEKLTSGMKGKEGEAAKKAFDSLKKAGLDPSKDMKEIAVCVRDKGGKDLVIGIGGNLKDAPKKLVDAMHEAGEKKIEVTDVDGMKAINIEGNILASVTDSVMIFATGKDSDAHVKAAKKEEDLSSEYGGGSGHVLAFKGEIEGGKFDVLLAEKGTDLELKAIVDVPEEKMKKAKKTPEEAKKEFEKVIKDLAGMLAKSPISAIAEDIEKTKLEIDGNKVTVTLTIASAHLADAVKKGSEDPEGVAKAFDGKADVKAEPAKPAMKKPGK